MVLRFTYLLLLHCLDQLTCLIAPSETWKLGLFRKRLKKEVRLLTDQKSFSKVTNQTYTCFLRKMLLKNLFRSSKLVFFTVQIRFIENHGISRVLWKAQKKKVTSLHLKSRSYLISGSSFAIGWHSEILLASKSTLPFVICSLAMSLQCN